MTHIRSLAIAALCLALVHDLPTQRQDKVFKTVGGQASLSYGVVIVGSHGLHELQVGASWRMGQGDASLMITQLPLVSGDVIIAPGSYQVQIFRAAERDLRLSFGGGSGRFGGSRGGPARGGRGGGNRGGNGGTGDGGTTGTGGNTGGDGRDRGGRGGGNQLPGKITNTKKPTKKLAIDWVKPGKGTAKLAGTTATSLQIDFGRHGLRVPMHVVKASSKNVKSFRALTFKYPISMFKAGLDRGMVPTITLLARARAKKGAPLVGFNIMVGSAAAEVVPLPAATANRGGRGGRGGGRGGRGGGTPRGGRDTATAADSGPLAGSVVWSPAQNTAESKTITIQALKVVKKTIEFEVLAGDQIGRVSVPLPKLPKK